MSLGATASKGSLLVLANYLGVVHDLRKKTREEIVVICYQRIDEMKEQIEPPPSF